MSKLAQPDRPGGHPATPKPGPRWPGGATRRASLVVAFDRLGPYHWSRLRAFGGAVALELFPDHGEYAWDKVRDPEVPYLAAFPGRGPGVTDAATVRVRCRSLLEGAGPEVVAVPGWSGPGAVGLLLACLDIGIPTVVMSETTAWDAPRRGVREWVKRQRVGLFDAALVGGTPHRDYLTALGMPGWRVALGYDAVDNGHFGGPAAEPPAGPDGPFFLASCRFIAKKNLGRLLEAYARYRELAGAEAWKLVLLGDGVLRGALEDAAGRPGLRGHVSMPGFQQYGSLPGYYQAAGAFVHASTVEPWGLVVNEAMAAGLPVVVSERCGCARDLVEHGVNGFVFDPADTGALAGLMLRTARMPAVERQAMGARGRDTVADWGPARFADGLAVAASVAITTPRRKRPLAAAMLAAVGR